MLCFSLSSCKNFADIFILLTVGQLQMLMDAGLCYSVHTANN